MKKATVRHSLDKRKILSDGKFPVKLRVIFNRKDKRYATGITLSAADYEKLSTDKKLRPLWLKIAAKIEEADTIIQQLDDNFSFDVFERILFKEQPLPLSGLNLFDFFSNYIAELETNEKLKSKDSYSTTKNHLINYCKKDLSGKQLRNFENKNYYSLTGVTTEFLRGFEKYLDEKGLAQSSIGVYMRDIRSIYNRAIRLNLINKDLYPFGINGYTPPATKKSKKALTLTDVSNIYNYNTDDERQQWARDMFLFSYFSNGLNVKDIALLKYSDIKENIISFVRAKIKEKTRSSQQSIRVIVTEDIERIIKRWSISKLAEDDYIFGIIPSRKSTPKETFGRINSTIKQINKQLKKIAENVGLSRVPTTNFARHTFSTVLKNAGVPVAMISEQLGHTSITTTQNYLSSFEDERLAEVSKHLTAFKIEKK